MVGQEIDVWVLARTRVRLRVGRSYFFQSFGCLSKMPSVSVAPSVNSKALLVTSGTELSIAPKTRGATNGASASASLPPPNGDARLNGVDGHPLHAEGEPTRVAILRTLPPRLMPSFFPSCPAIEDGTLATVGLVSRSLLNTLAKPPCDAEPRSWIGKIRRIKGPLDPSADQSASQSAAPAAPRVLVPTEPGTSKAAGPSLIDRAPQDEILVAYSKEIAVPEGHMVLYGSVCGTEDWDHVK